MHRLEGSIHGTHPTVTQRMLGIVDETGCAVKTRSENLGTLFEVNKPFAIGTLLMEKVSAIAAISSDGLLGVELTNSADNFANFICGTVFQTCSPLTL